MSVQAVGQDLLPRKDCKSHQPPSSPHCENLTIFEFFISNDTAFSSLLVYNIIKANAMHVHLPKTSMTATSMCFCL